MVIDNLAFSQNVPNKEMLQDKRTELLPGSCLMGREEAKGSGACVCHSCKELAALWEGVCCYDRKAVCHSAPKSSGTPLPVTATTPTPEVEL